MIKPKTFARLRRDRRYGPWLIQDVWYRVTRQAVRRVELDVWTGRLSVPRGLLVVVTEGADPAPTQDDWNFVPWQLGAPRHRIES